MHFRFKIQKMHNEMRFSFSNPAKNAKKVNLPVDSGRGRWYNTSKFQSKAMRKQSNPDANDPRERAMVEIPYDPPDEEPFQVQTQRG